MSHKLWEAGWKGKSPSWQKSILLCNIDVIEGYINYSHLTTFPYHFVHTIHTNSHNSDNIFINLRFGESVHCKYGQHKVLRLHTHTLMSDKFISFLWYLWVSAVSINFISRSFKIILWILSMFAWHNSLVWRSASDFWRLEKTLIETRTLVPIYL